MAKGVEDTAFYRYARLLALNDVGGDPSRFSLRVDAFHAANRERAERFPRNLLVTQTHDTKRSGDVRARIGALAGMADEFAAHTRTLAERLPLADLRRRARPRSSSTSSSRRCSASGRSPRTGSRSTSRRRCARPSSTRPGSARTRRHEAAVQSFARALLTHRDFLRDFVPFQRARRRGGRPRRARPAAAQADRPGRPRHLPGRRAAVPLARGPGQPPRGRLGRAPRRAGRPAAEARPDPARAGAARPSGPRPSRGPTSRCPPARTRSRSCAAATCVAGALLRGEPVELTLPPGDVARRPRRARRLRDPHARRHRAAQAAGDRSLPHELLALDAVEAVGAGVVSPLASSE